MNLFSGYSQSVVHQLLGWSNQIILTTPYPPPPGGIHTYKQ